jgi:hypothetical protein
MPESLAIVGALPLLGPDGWYDHVVGWHQGAEVDRLGDTGDCESRWPSPLDVAVDPQLAGWRLLKELADAEDEWKPNVEDEVPSPVRLAKKQKSPRPGYYANGNKKETGTRTFHFFVSGFSFGLF